MTYVHEQTFYEGMSTYYHGLVEVLTHLVKKLSFAHDLAWNHGCSRGVNSLVNSRRS